MDSSGDSASSASSPASSFSALPEADRAPLASGASLYDPSIDGVSSVSADPDGPRPEKLEDLSADDKAAALEIKARGNKCFTSSEYQEALDLYTLSLNRNPFDPAVWCNRAAVRLKREEHGLAIMDTSKAIELDARYLKAYFRRATAQISILKPKEALKDFKKCIDLDPKNAAARIQHDATIKLVRKLEFERAIAAADEEPPSSRIRRMIADGACEIEKDWAGPQLEFDDDGVGRPTEAFVEKTIEWFKNGKLLPKRYVYEIVIGCLAILRSEESMNEYTVSEGETCDVIGDMHGQFFDVVHMLTLTGMPSATHAMVFNGDFVDRGSWSTEVVIVAFLLKWLWPNKVFLNRGNHETSDMNLVYGFSGETKKKYSELTYKLFEEAFICLPLACLVSASQAPRPKASSLPKEPTLSPDGRKRYFVVHGGLFSRDGVDLDEIRKIPRIQKRQPGQEGLMMEALWTDPQDGPGRGPSKRGVGLGFGPDVTKAWCEHVKVTAVIRSHEVRPEGYLVEHAGRCITVFSAPNYVDQVGNKAAFVRIDDAGELSYTTFSAQPHPDIKPMAYAGPLGMSSFL